MAFPKTQTAEPELHTYTPNPKTHTNTHSPHPDRNVRSARACRQQDTETHGTGGAHDLWFVDNLQLIMPNGINSRKGWGSKAVAAVVFAEAVVHTTGDNRFITVITPVQLCSPPSYICAWMEAVYVR